MKVRYLYAGANFTIGSAAVRAREEVELDDGYGTLRDQDRSRYYQPREFSSHVHRRKMETLGRAAAGVNVIPSRLDFYFVPPAKFITFDDSKIDLMNSGGKQYFSFRFGVLLW